MDTELMHLRSLLRSEVDLPLELKEKLKKDLAASKIQAQWRKYKAAKDYSAMIRGFKWLQITWR